MNDIHTTIATLKDAVAAMVNEREWHHFHTLKNLAMDISVEAAELMEHFLWCDSKDSNAIFAKQQQEIEHELADVLIAAFLFANKANIDIAKAFMHKLEEIKAKYPIELSKGKSDKYTAYMNQKSMTKK